jgi:hypothetical protein
VAAGSTARAMAGAAIERARRRVGPVVVHSA